MTTNDQAGDQKKEGDFGTTLCCAVGAGLWWFLSSYPSASDLACAGFLLFSLFSGYCALAVLLPEPDSGPMKSTFAPLPQYQTERVKSLTY